MPAVVAARRHFSDLIDAARQGVRTPITRNGKLAGGIVSPADLRLLDDLEEQQDIADARAARQEARRKGWIVVKGDVRKFIAAL